ncbi:MAG: mutS 1 [Bacteroidetes bacterium]|nr:mutS 1 [Bacteroidota bacterium]
MTTGNKAEYSDLAKTYRDQAEKERKSLLVISVFRFLTFAGGFIIVWFSFTFSKYYGFAALLLVTGIFIYLLKIYSDHLARQQYLSDLELINLNEVKAAEGDYSVFGDGSSFGLKGHDFSYDTDLFGPGSLFQFLNRTCTGYGSEVLAGWLADPYILAPSLKSRQETISELAGKLTWRQSFLATGINKNLNSRNIQGLTKWLSAETKISSSGFKKAILWIFPSLACVSLFLTWIGSLHYSVFILLFLINLFIILLNLKNTQSIHGELTGRYNFLYSLGSLIKLIENEPFGSPLIGKIRKDIKVNRRSAVGALKELSNIIRAFDSRLNIIVGFVLNGLLLWDLHCIRKLDSWRADYRGQFPGWLDLLGQTDAFISLGNYSYNNPEFVFPKLAEDKAPFRAKQLGHPLIAYDKRVCNDFNIPSEGRICIITGANMAGKSTFLRSVAVNMILAMAGAPVCAAEMKFVPVRLFTSMRTTDSLASNESYFYAELKRLRQLEQKILSGEDILFILDEILKGTNSEDKSLGSRLFLNRIISLGGTGLIATHDTSLGSLEAEHPEVIINKCIEVEIDGEIIRFDYKLRNGIASKKNAVLLMKQMGIIP